MGNISQNFVGMPGGLLMSVIAFSTVFLVIIGLMLMMMALKKFSAAAEAREKEAAATSAAPVRAQETTTPRNAAAAVSVEDDSELIVAITAAITAMTGVAARVVSFKPAAPHTSGSAWRMTGVLQNSEGFAN